MNREEIEQEMQGFQCFYSRKLEKVTYESEENIWPNRGLPLRHNKNRKWKGAFF